MYRMFAEKEAGDLALWLRCWLCKHGVWISRASMNAKWAWKTALKIQRGDPPRQVGYLELVISTSWVQFRHLASKDKVWNDEEDSVRNFRTNPCPSSIHPYPRKYMQAHAKTKKRNHRMVCVEPRRMTRASLREVQCTQGYWARIIHASLNCTEAG